MSNARRIVIIAAMALIAGCDTLHGLRIQIASIGQAAVPPVCIEKGLRKAGLEAFPVSATQSGVREAGHDGAWFFISHEHPTRVEFYFQTMHEATTCEAFRPILLKMRRAASFAQEACKMAGEEITITEKWSQASCGL